MPMAIKATGTSQLDIPRGTRDFGTHDAIRLNNMLSVVEEVFKRHGFSPIITPSIEKSEVLSAKAYGEEQTKEMYFIEGKESALRFDFTVPLARYMSMNKDIPLPFRRYQIGTVWRRDEPQHMRSREFIQADVDIVGSASQLSDFECISATMDAIDSIGVSTAMLLINSRPILNAIVGHFHVPEPKTIAAIRLIDKMHKTSVSETVDGLKQLGMQENDAQEMISFMNMKATNDEKLEKLEMEIDLAKQEAQKMKSLLSLLGKADLSGKVAVDLSLARGMDYYTGFVWEVIISQEGKRLPSIASGGRYDGLIGMYSKSNLPAVGFSIGISRIFDLQESYSKLKTYSKVLIAPIGEQSIDYAVSASKSMRNAGIYTDLSVSEKGVSKQLEYANSLGIRYVAIVGSREIAQGKVNLRDMQSGQEELLEIQAAISKIKGE